MSDSPFQDSVIREIHLLKDQRQAGGIVPHLQSRSALRRYHAALALASVGDSLTVPYLELALKDRSQEVREMAAFALAQTSSMAAERVLLKAVQDQTRARDRIFLLEQLGACSFEEGISFLLRLNPGDEPSQTGLMKGMYRMVRRHGMRAEFQVRLIELLNIVTPEEAVRFAALTLQRSKEILPSTAEKRLIEQYLKYKDHETRRALIGAMTLISNPVDTSFYAKNFPGNVQELLLISWLDWALKHPGIPGIPQKLFALWNEKVSWNTRYSLQKAIRTPGNALSKTYPPSAFPWSLLSQSGSGNKSDQVIHYLLDTLVNPYEQALFVQELAVDPSLEKVLRELFRNSETPLVLRNAALEKLLSNNQVRQDELIKECFESKEASFVSLASISLVDKQRTSDLKTWLLSRLPSLKEHFRNASGWETYLDLCKLEDFLKGSTTPIESLSFVPRFGHRELEEADSSYLVEMRTSKGLISFRLHTSVAPFTVLNIIQSVKQGYYNNKFIHRVVPGFVAQGGCHRGDGWGSPEWLQRSEFSPMPFDAGAIGIASVGKDTEGLQLFWMQGHAPHLEGRYSRIGEIESGLDVLMQLAPGDKIIGMELVKP